MDFEHNLLWYRSRSRSLKVTDFDLFFAIFFFVFGPIDAVRSKMNFGYDLSRSRTVEVTDGPRFAKFFFFSPIYAEWLKMAFGLDPRNPEVGIISDCW